MFLEKTELEALHVGEVFGVMPSEEVKQLLGL